jgi:hypothetical protein
LVLQRDNTASKVFSRWRGPAEIGQVKSPYSYIVALGDARYHMHANNLRKYHVRVAEVTCECFVNIAEVNNNLTANCHCAIIYDNDVDFGKIDAIDVSRDHVDNLLPSQKIKSTELAHLSEQQRVQILKVRDKFPEVFSEIPGLCKVNVYHEIPIAPDFRPKRLKAYRVPENLKPQVDRQIAELLRLGFIEPSTSPMASPIVCVLKGKNVCS